MKILTILIISSLLFATISFATVINVPEDYPTIQLAVNFASTGDTVLVADGVYTETDINWSGKHITVMSANGPENCIFITDHEVFDFFQGDGVNETDIISGFKFTITGVGNNTYGDGSAIFLMGNALNISIQNCEFINCYSPQNQGVITLAPNNYYIGGINLSDCKFINNVGGAIWTPNEQSTQTSLIDNCLFYNSGRAIDSHVELEVTNSIFVENSVSGDGSAISQFSPNKPLTIENCLFLRNESLSGDNRAAITANVSTVSITNSTFQGNDSIAVYLGGGSTSDASNYNNFIGNSYAIYNDNSNVFHNAENNWWGHFTGPYHPTSNADGQGDSVNINVDVIPFLTEPDIISPVLAIQNVSVDTFGVDFVNIIWDSSPIGDLAGYKVYIDSDTIDAGLDTMYTLSGLNIGQDYGVSVTCYDNSGNESWFSEEILVSLSPVSIISAEDTLDFGAVLVGDSAQSSLIIYNNGTADLTITNISSSAPEFEPEINTLIVSPSSQGSIPITFTPTEFGLVTANLTIISDAYNNPELIITLLGSGDLSPNPTMLSVVDVPEDQGGQVRVSFARSKYDGIDTTLQIESYTVWRYIDDTEWDAVGMFNAVQDSIYNYVAPTLCDSTFEGICWSTFKVSAHTPDPDIFFWSDSLSGYSIDNIAPEAPTGLLATAMDESIYLTWNVSPEEDFHYFILEKSTDIEFTDLETINTIDTSYNDTEYVYYVTYYYRLSVTDYTGNVSDYSETVEATILSINSEGLIPEVFALQQNYPNPFNPITQIKYDLPENSFVNIIIYDMLGRQVRTLVNQTQDAGFKSVLWNAIDSFGSPVSAGVYLYQIQAGEFVQTKKMVLLK